MPFIDMLMKNQIKICLIFLTVSSLVFTPKSFSETPIPYHLLPTAKSAIIVEKTTGRVLFERQPNLKLPPASTVKLLTALVVLDRLTLDQVVTVHRSVVGTQPSRINLRAGEQFYVRDLVKAVLISSANDAARALAIAVAGSEWKFASLMNSKAKSLGATNSNFVTASGLPAENQYSTVSDLFQIMLAAEQNAFIMQIMPIRNTSIKSLNGRVVHLKNHNKMLWRDSREILGKTGWTRNARHCFVGRIRHDGKEVYVALMNSKKSWYDLRYFTDRFVGGRSTISAVEANKRSHRAAQRYGFNVRQIQQALRNAGYFKRSPTGYFGSITKRAVIRFQKAHKLDPDGIVGPKTWAALSKYL